MPGPIPRPVRRRILIRLTGCRSRVAHRRDVPAGDREVLKRRDRRRCLVDCVRLPGPNLRPIRRRIRDTVPR
jgi:hypothetical protein